VIIENLDGIRNGKYVCVLQVINRVRPIRVKPLMSDVPIFRRKNSDVRFRFWCRSC